MQVRILFTTSLLIVAASAATIKRQSLSGTSSRHHVAFTAILPSTLHRLPDYSTIIFGNAITNVGGAYNIYTGRFTAPFDGTYNFVVGLECEYHQYTSFEFVRDGVSKMLAHCDSRGMDGTESNSRMLILHMNKGQQLWLRTTGVNHGNGALRSQFSNLSGYLLFED